MLKTIATGPPWLHVDWRTAGPAPDDHAHALPRQGVRKHAAPDEPSRFPEAAAQPARSLRARDVLTTRVWRCDVRSAERDYEPELPANLASNTPFAPPTTRW